MLPIQNPSQHVGGGGFFNKKIDFGVCFPQKKGEYTIKIFLFLTQFCARKKGCYQCRCWFTQG